MIIYGRARRLLSSWAILNTMKLPRIQTDQQGYALLELDNTQRWLTHWGLETDSSSGRLLTTTLQNLLQAAQGSISGVILDAAGVQVIPSKPADIGVLWQLEEPSDAVDPLTVPTLSPDWTVEHIRNNLGLAKLELFYHPSEPEALTKKQLVAEIFDFCQYQNIDFLLMLKLYSPTGSPLSPGDWQQAQLEAVDEFHDSCSLLGLESPQEALAAATITAALDIPWVVTAGSETSYDQFKEQLRQALEAGAMGYVVGATLWPELYRSRRKDHGIDEVALVTATQKQVRDRMVELYRILGENLVH